MAAQEASCYSIFMIILGIETSCDETAISLIEAATDGKGEVGIRVLADKTLTQIELHKQYGGVFPNVAKREHSRNLIPLLQTILTESGSGNHKTQSPKSKQITNTKFQILNTILEREPELLEQFLAYIPTIQKPQIDLIAVTEGPGLEPCLWTGINFAQALSLVWDIPVLPVNHMEGHIFSALLRKAEISNNQFPISKQASNFKSEAPKKETTNYLLLTTNFPTLALLISGGHTELVLIKDSQCYEIVGETKDDAIGEAFDKVARLLGLPYPGGPEISKLAEELRMSLIHNSKFILHGIALPRPMLHSGDFNFSFSGIKTAVLYLLKKLPPLTDAIRKEIALEFENAVTEVLIAKTRAAIEHYGAKALLLGGGVVANTHIRTSFEALGQKLDIPVLIPEKGLATDNALMIAVAGWMRFQSKPTPNEAAKEPIRARGNRRLDNKEG